MIAGEACYPHKTLHGPDDLVNLAQKLFIGLLRDRFNIRSRFLNVGHANEGRCYIRMPHSELQGKFRRAYSA